jgi:hypothetical protein
MSLKEQSRDRAPSQPGRHHRFRNHGRNSLYNLRLKNDLLRDKEARVA